ncbi:hypothetical protein [Nocardiopsis synnemataformans]|uniref:hypothetical protein n=1 Tax=Nocardiopsis synnemataformans TaxID=61305 RepID=UPI003EBF9EA6
MNQTTAPTRPVLVIDMGGVVFDYSFHRAVRAWAEAADADPVSLVQRWRIDEEFDAFERGQLNPADYLDHLRHLLDVDLSDTDLTRGWNAIYGPGNTALVDLLATVKPQVRALVGVSNTNTLHAQEWKRRYSDLLMVFDHIVCSHEIGTTKPQPAFFDHIAAHHHVGRHELTLVDDIAVVVHSARDLGLSAHHYSTVPHLARFLDTL